MKKLRFLLVLAVILAALPAFAQGYGLSQRSDRMRV